MFSILTVLHILLGVVLLHIGSRGLGARHVPWWGTPIQGKEAQWLSGVIFLLGLLIAGQLFYT